MNLLAKLLRDIVNDRLRLGYILNFLSQFLVFIQNRIIYSVGEYRLKLQP